VRYFAKPGVAIAFGAFMLCAETCLHADSFLAADASGFELPIYDWTAGVFLLTAGVASQRSWTLTRRQYQAVAWAFMLSLLFGALVSFVQEWLMPPNIVEWGISEGAFVAIILALATIALCGLVSTLKADDSLAT
jgi:uncharacterized membrane protein (DUF485 family)